MEIKVFARGAAILVLGAALAIPTILASPQKAAAQQHIAAKPQAAAIPAYPESAEGLKNLLQDWFAAIKAGDTAKSSQYLESFAIPNHQEWFVKTFGAAEGASIEAKYKESQTKFADALVVRAKGAVQAEKFLVKIRLFDKSACGQPPELLALSAAMLRSTPIYRAFSHRDSNDNSPSFLGNFVYVHGGFRYFDQQLIQAMDTTPPMRITRAADVQAESACGGPFQPLYPKEARSYLINTFNALSG